MLAAVLSGCNEDTPVVKTPASDVSQGRTERAVTRTPSAPADVEGLAEVALEQKPEERNSAASALTVDDSTYTGDLAVLKKRGKLRILIPANIGGAFYLPRKGWPVDAQHETASSFARRHGLEPVLVPVASFADMIPSLLEGKGDIIAANLTVTERRREKIAFSVPLTTVHQQVLVAQDQTGIQGVKDLVGKRVMVDPHSSFWDRMAALQKEYPGIELVKRPEGLTDEAELDAVAHGKIDAAVRDSNVASMYLSFRDDIKVAFALRGTDDIAWGIRPGSPHLRAALNKFLHLELLAGNEPIRHTDGFEGIKKRKVLRVLMPNNAASYFLYKGELHGFEYELAKAFADAHKLRLEVIVPETHEQLLNAGGWPRRHRSRLSRTQRRVEGTQPRILATLSLRPASSGRQGRRSNERYMGYAGPNGDGSPFQSVLARSAGNAGVGLRVRSGGRSRAHGDRRTDRACRRG